MSAAEKRGNSRRTSGGRETRTVLAQQESEHCESNVWTDLCGREHAERAREVPDHDSTAPRVVGQLEQAWALAGDRCRAELAAQVLALPNPIVAHATRDPRSVSLDRTAEVPTVGNAMGSISGRSDEEEFPLNSDRASMGDYVNGGPDVMCDYTWVVQAPEASAVLPWANGLFDHLNPSPNEMVRLPDSDLWTLTWRLPASWRPSYRISVWAPSELLDTRPGSQLCAERPWQDP